ncbi:MAG: hypothetical protein HY815_01875 [Candidatus Riflebacteria bacterium]|nr:hypothetical protein [Candidatus Riflebacteria bacterium]
MVRPGSGPEEALLDRLLGLQADLSRVKAPGQLADVLLPLAIAHFAPRARGALVGILQGSHLVCQAGLAGPASSTLATDLAQELSLAMETLSTRFRCSPPGIVLDQVKAPRTGSLTFVAGCNLVVEPLVRDGNLVGILGVLAQDEGPLSSPDWSAAPWRWQRSDRPWRRPPSTR